MTSRQMQRDKQLQRTVIGYWLRAASPPLHYAPAARWTRDRAAAELRPLGHIQWCSQNSGFRHP